ncbi:MAG: amidohydrolase [Deltaproteobacteria bacterium]|nr:amidohydrolase [Deltaproteobacteria bacterium]
MEREEAYIGFPPLAEKSTIVEALLTDPPGIRWRIVRDLFQIKDQNDRQEIIETLRLHLEQMEDWRIRNRIILGLRALHQIPQETGYRLVRLQGALTPTEVEQRWPLHSSWSDRPLLPVVDFHIHPKMPDLKFFSDMRAAGVTHGVILATDTDPNDLDRPEVRSRLHQAFSSSPAARGLSFQSLLRHIRASLYSPSHVTNEDVADWIRDYPDRLIGFGSVNLSKDGAYVRKKLDELQRFQLRGIKFLPYSQFFNPAENEHMGTVMEFCRQTGAVILSHSGCGPGPFEIIELSQNSHPALWSQWLAKYPDVPVVLAHCGSYSTAVPGIWLFDTLQLGQKYQNLYVDLAAVDWLLDREVVIREIRKTIGFNRVLFGTDYPLPLASGVSWASIVQRIRVNTYLTSKEKQKVLGQNAARLLGLG